MDVYRNCLIFSRLVHLIGDTVLGRVSDNGSNTSATINRQVQTGNCPAAWSRYLTAIITPRRDTKPDKKTASGRETVESRFQHKLDEQQLPTDSESQLRFLHEYDEYDRHVERRQRRRQHRQQRRFEGRVSWVREAVCQQRELRARWEEAKREEAEREEAERARREERHQRRLVEWKRRRFPNRILMFVCPGPRAEEEGEAPRPRRRNRQKRRRQAAKARRANGGS